MRCSYCFPPKNHNSSHSGERRREGNQSGMIFFLSCFEQVTEKKGKKRKEQLLKWNPSDNGNSWKCLLKNRHSWFMGSSHLWNALTLVHHRGSWPLWSCSWVGAGLTAQAPNWEGDQTTQPSGSSTLNIWGAVSMSLNCFHTGGSKTVKCTWECDGIWICLTCSGPK